MGRRESCTIEGECLPQDSKQKLVFSGESPLKRVKVFIAGAMTGMEACCVSAEWFFSLEGQKNWIQTSDLCPARMVRGVGVGGSCERILIKGCFTFRYSILQTQAISLEPREFLWTYSRRWGFPRFNRLCISSLPSPSFASAAAGDLHPLCPALGAAACGNRIALRVFAGD